MKLWTVVIVLVVAIASFYGIEASLSLMSQPSDFAFWGGVAVLGFLVFVWLELGNILVSKIMPKLKEWYEKL